MRCGELGKEVFQSVFKESRVTVDGIIPPIAQGGMDGQTGRVREGHNPTTKKMTRSLI